MHIYISVVSKPITLSYRPLMIYSAKTVFNKLSQLICVILYCCTRYCSSDTCINFKSLVRLPYSKFFHWNFDYPPMYKN